MALRTLREKEEFRHYVLMLTKLKLWIRHEGEVFSFRLVVQTKVLRRD